MIDFICGQIVEINDDSIVVKCNDVGYFMFVSSNTANSLSVGENAQLFTYLQVKQDGIVLFGFATKEEKNMFLQLITVSGVGCKSAVAILSGTKLNDLALAILNKDTKTLTSIKGLGKKTSERIILELNEKMAVFSPLQTDFVPSNNTDEAISVLRTLGISNTDAIAKVEKALNSGATTTEDILNHALKNY